MEIKDIKLGTRFEIEILDSYAEKSGTTYISQLLEFTKDKSMIISTPIHEARLVYIPTDSLVRIFFIHHKRGFLSFTARLNYKGTRGKISVMGIKPESELETLQRRKHYRLDCLLGVEYIILDSTGEPSTTEWQKGVFKNISASGSCLVIDEKLPKGTEIKIKLFLSDIVQIGVIATIMRTTPVDNQNIKKYEHGMLFTEISDRDQEKLIKYIFEQQRMFLSKENGI